MEILPNTVVNVRLFTYKSKRNYGGRDIQSFPSILKATFLYKQNDGTYLVELNEPFHFFRKGHKIAVLSKDFNL